MNKTISKAVALGALTCFATACSANSKTDDEKAPTEILASTSDAVAKATANANSEDLMKTADEAHSAMREIRAARLAIFDGSGPSAKLFVQDAINNLEASKKLSRKIASKDAKAEEDYIAFDMAIDIAEGFDVSSEKSEKIAEANKHIGKGDHKKAVETLKLADINVMTSAALIPVNSAIANLKNAERFITQGKFYDANLSLKAVEDSVLVQAFDVDGKPSPSTAKKS